VKNKHIFIYIALLLFADVWYILEDTQEDTQKAQYFAIIKCIYTYFLTLAYHHVKKVINSK